MMMIKDEIPKVIRTMMIGKISKLMKMMMMMASLEIKVLMMMIR